MSYFNCLFYFSSEKSELVEIKRLDLAEGFPKSHIYKWLFIENGVVNEFTFESMSKTDSQECREFKEAMLTFDLTNAVLKMGEREIQFERKNAELIPTELKVRITNYFR